jgi:hypothetical protein
MSDMLSKAVMFKWLNAWCVSPTPCPYCANPDRNSIFDSEHPWNGCKHVTSKSGEDPPCVCDGYASNGQLSTLGLSN